MEKKNKAAIIVGLCAAYFICYFTKLSPSAIMPSLQQELGLTSSQVGFISGIYFFSYALMQFFTGSLCRRFSAPWVIAIGLLIASLGLWIFATAGTFVLLALGRFFIGLGIAPIFIGLVYYFQQCFTGQAYVKAYGSSIVVGNLGAVCASTPLKALLNYVDRGKVFIAICVVSLVTVIYLVVLCLVSNEKGERTEGLSVFKRIGRDTVEVAKTPVLRCVLLYWFVESIMLMSYQGLWCIKWSVTAFPAFERMASFSGLAVSLGVILSGRLGLVFKRRATWTLACWRTGWFALLAVLFVTVTKFMPQTVFCVALSMLSDFVFGFAGGSIVLTGGALAKESTVVSRNADIMGVINGFGCFSQQLSQWGTGAGVDFFSKRTSLNWAFGATYICLDILFAFIIIYSRHILVKKGNENDC